MAEGLEKLREKARRTLSEVGFEERLVGFESSPAMGNSPFSLYSLREVADFLSRNDDCLVNYLDLRELGEWVEKVLGDAELRQAIAKELETESEYQARARRLAQVIGERITQLESIVSA